MSDKFTAQDFTQQELAACAEREVKMRKRAYPRYVSLKRMSAEQAEREVAMMAAIAARLRAEAGPARRALPGQHELPL